ncbi:MAG: hypothetical protein ACTSU4_10325 [Promethearchaeota archaeon]
MRIKDPLLALLYLPGIVFYFMKIPNVALIFFIFLQLHLIFLMVHGKIKTIIEEQVNMQLEKEKNDILIQSKVWKGELRIFESNQGQFLVFLEHLID